MKSLRIIASVVMLGAAACGTEPNDLDATLEAPQATEARVSISAALDVSELLDAGLAERVIIDDITVNLSEVRLLAADPRIPPGGYSLLTQATLLEFYGADESKLDLPFPEQFLSQTDLAVYLRIAPSEELDSASIVVSGRYYSHPLSGGQSSLKASEDETSAQDPDGDPMDPADRFWAQDPDGDPISPACAQDPDGDPIMCQRRGLTGEIDRGSTEEEESIAFELRTSDIADLVATLGTEVALNVVVGIPAGQWFTSDVVDSLERALDEARPHGDTTKRENEKRSEAEVIVVNEATERGTDRMRAGRGDYFVTNRELDDLTVRR